MSEYDEPPFDESMLFDPKKTDWDKKGSLSTTPPPPPPGMESFGGPMPPYPPIGEQEKPPLNIPTPPLPPGMQGGQEFGYPPLGEQETPPLSTTPPPLPPGMEGYGGPMPPYPPIGEQKKPPLPYPPIGGQETPPLNVMPPQQEKQGGQEFSYPPLGEQEMPQLDIKDSIEERRIFFEQVTAPEMRASLDRFTVREYSDVLGKDLKNRIGEAFSHRADFSSRRNEQFYYDLYLAETDATVQDVREVSLSNGETRLVRMRAYDDMGLITTEVLNPNIKPNILKDPNKINSHKDNLIVYEKFIVSKDVQNSPDDIELAVDLLDLVAPNSQVVLGTTLDYRSESMLQQATGNIILENGLDPLGDSESKILMHEAGHSYQSVTKKGNVENTAYEQKILNSGQENLKKFLWAESAAVERQTNAYGMTAARIAKEQGLDLTQIMNKESYDRALQTYQNAVDIQNIPVDYLTERRRQSRAAEEKKRKAREAEADSQSGSGLLSKVKNVFKRRK